MSPQYDMHDDDDENIISTLYHVIRRGTLPHADCVTSYFRRSLEDMFYLRILSSS